MTTVEPKFKVGDRAFSHYVRNVSAGKTGWGTVAQVSHTEEPGTHGVTGSPLPASTWYYVDMDSGSRELLDDANGNWELARLVPPAIAARYGYGTDPKGQR